MNIVNPTLLLVAANLLFAGGGTYWALDTDPTWYPPKAKRPAKGLLEPGKDIFSRKEMLELPDTLMRPLFSETRRPPPPPPPPPPPAGSAEALVVRDPFKDVRLIGLIEGAGNTGSAIVQSGKEVRRLVVGQTFEGWRLERVAGFNASFSSGSGSRTLTMTFLPQPSGLDGGKDAVEPQAAPASGGRTARAADPEKERIRAERNAEKLAEIQKRFEAAAAGKKK